MLILFHKRTREMVARMKVRHSTIIHHLNGKSKESWQIDSETNGNSCFVTLKKKERKKKDKQNPFLKRVIEESCKVCKNMLRFHVNTEDRNRIEIVLIKYIQNVSKKATVGNISQ